MWRALKAEMPDLWGYEFGSVRDDNLFEMMSAMVQTQAGKKFKPPKSPRPRKKEKEISLKEALAANKGKLKELE